jgi:hypothetical protein
VQIYVPNMHFVEKQYLAQQNLLVWVAM